MNDLLKKNAFNYFVIFVVIVYYISNLNITGKFIFGVCVGIGCVLLLFENDKKENINADIIKKKKIELIRPLPKHQKEEILDYLFSIQDFYQYNPIAYENMVEGIDLFFDRYYETKKDNSLASVNCEIMNNQKRDIVNSLHSIIYNFPVNNEYTEKLEIATSKIGKILEKYLDEILELNNKFIYYEGIKNTSKFTTKSKVKPINLYNDDYFSTYEIV